jgi:hypothetical protein
MGVVLMVTMTVGMDQTASVMHCSLLVLGLLIVSGVASQYVQVGDFLSHSSQPSVGST